MGMLRIEIVTGKSSRQASLKNHRFERGNNLMSLQESRGRSMGMLLHQNMNNPSTHPPTHHGRGNEEDDKDQTDKIREPPTEVKE